VPNDKIVGLRNPGGEIIVHRKNCNELNSQFDTSGMNFFELEWSGIKTDGLQTVLIITAEDHDEVIGLVTSQLAGSEDILIRGLSYSTLEGILSIKLTISFNNLSSLAKIKDIIKQLPGIKEIRRFE
jgi:(p)ppGpp synthase/HD superfamily hydrolase